MSNNQGDQYLEQQIDQLGENTTSNQTTVMIPGSTVVKKDYLIITPRPCKNNQIVKFGVYSVLVDSVVHTITLTQYNYSEIPYIEYEEGVGDPSSVIDTVYTYQVGRERSLVLKKYAKQVITRLRL